MADLITLAEYKDKVGIDQAQTRYDKQITALIPAASTAVRNYAGRSFEAVPLVPVTDARTYEYDGSGFLDIDDAVAVTEVSTDFGYPGGGSYTLDPQEYTAQPHGGLVYYYLLIHGYPRGPSGEMGFKQNLDTLERSLKPPIITVTATWGWPSIPEDVKLAAAWTVKEAVNEEPEGLTSEAISGYARSWAGSNTPLAIPNRARDLLINYQRAY